MKIATVSLAAVLWLVASGSPVIAASGPASEATPENVQSSIDSSQRAETLSRIAAGIAAGSAAMQAFHGAPSVDAENKDKLNPQVPGLECYIDRILNYVSCFGAAIQTEEAADRLFTRFVDELHGVLPAERWQGSARQPGVNTVRSYIYADRRSDAHIDIDVVSEPEKDRDDVYIVSIYAWTY